MNLRDELKQLSDKKRLYFEYLFPEIQYKKDRQPLTVDRLLKVTESKTLDSFLAWEKTGEFIRLKSLYYQQLASSDFFEIYDNVAEKAKSGDEKAIKLFLTLSKELKSMTQIVKQAASDEDEDGLLYE